MEKRGVFNHYLDNNYIQVFGKNIRLTSLQYSANFRRKCRIANSGRISVSSLIIIHHFLTFAYCVIYLCTYFFRKKKLILLWTDYFSKKDWLPSTTELDCPVKECVVTSDRSLLKYSSAVIMHWRNVDINDLPVCVSSETIHCPLWVLFNKESPHHTPRDIIEAIQDKVHWTVTYRKDSDIYAPYGKVVLKPMRSSAILG